MSKKVGQKKIGESLFVSVFWGLKILNLMRDRDLEITTKLFDISDAIFNMRDVLMQFGIELGDEQLRRFMPRDKNTVTLYEIREIVIAFVDWMLLVRRSMVARRPPVEVWPHIRDSRVFDQIMVALLNRFESL